MTEPVEVFIPGRPLTANRQRKATTAQLGRLIKEARSASMQAWADGPNTKLRHPVKIIAQPCYTNRRSIPDVGGVSPAVKACIDGIVDAGGLAGDTETLVTELTFRHSLVDPDGPMGLRLTCIEAPEC